MTQQQLDAAHPADPKNARIALALMAVGVLALVLRAAMGSGRGSNGLASILTVDAVTAVGAGAVMFFMNRGIGGRHQAVAALRPGCDVFDVWGAAGLKQALAAEGSGGPESAGHLGHRADDDDRHEGVRAVARRQGP